MLCLVACKYDRYFIGGNDLQTKWKPITSSVKQKKRKQDAFKNQVIEKDNYKQFEEALGRS